MLRSRYASVQLSSQVAGHDSHIELRYTARCARRKWAGGDSAKKVYGTVKRR